MPTDPIKHHHIHFLFPKKKTRTYIVVAEQVHIVVVRGLRGGGLAALGRRPGLPTGNHPVYVHAGVVVWVWWVWVFWKECVGSEGNGMSSSVCDASSGFDPEQRTDDCFTPARTS